MSSGLSADLRACRRRVAESALGAGGGGTPEESGPSRAWSSRESALSGGNEAEGARTAGTLLLAIGAHSSPGGTSGAGICAGSGACAGAGAGPAGAAGKRYSARWYLLGRSSSRIIATTFRPGMVSGRSRSAVWADLVRSMFAALARPPHIDVVEDARILPSLSFTRFTVFALLVQRAMSETTVRHKSQGKTDASAAREKLLKVPVRLQCLAHLLLPRHWRSVPRSRTPVVRNVGDNLDIEASGEVGKAVVTWIFGEAVGGNGEAVVDETFGEAVTEELKWAVGEAVGETRCEAVVGELGEALLW